MSMSIMQQQQQQNEVQEQSRCSYSRSRSCSSISMSRNWLMLLMLLLLAVVVVSVSAEPTIRSERSSTSTSSSILTTKMITNMNIDNDNDNDSATTTTTTTTTSSGGVDTEFADDYDDDFIVFPSLESSSDTEAENQQQYELSSHSSHVSGDVVSVVGSGDDVSVSVRGGGMTTTVDRNRILQFASLTPGSGPISPAPTYVDKCYVCGSEDSYVTTPDVNVTIIPGQTALCGALERAGRTGLIPQAGCYVSTTAAQASCNCQLNSPTDSSSGGSNGDSPVSAPSPTTTTTNAVCYLCEDSTLVVGNANETLLNLLLPDGIDPTCGAVEQAGLNQLLNKQICTLASQVAKQICSCQSSGTTTNMPVMAPAPVTSPSPVSSPMTNSPVVVGGGGGGEPTTNTAAPTLTAGGGRSPSSSSNGTSSSSTTNEPTSVPSSAESTPTTSSSSSMQFYYNNPMYVLLSTLMMSCVFVSIPIVVLF